MLNNLNELSMDQILQINEVLIIFVNSWSFVWPVQT